ncbi:MAG: hypothetical protein KJ970_00030 [Candidatus Eisenbacteria bacterium]|uniref:Uncharacterized protein n=1 Tax=Eiseniibacteriota bacterium TaxID=2212470 RepID=A0A948WAR5_UNCEI|nr:hypothetical protein [Candidatus Eisenbacteria bacterium]MBU2689288.1 hypothetical protein [Candidatus Eisenbacteria bacterium]
MQRFFLSGIDPDNQNLTPPAEGVWNGHESFLTDYAQAIHLEGRLEDLRLAHSVPSAFAQPIQFYYGLRDKDSPVHSATVSEWRGLLAMFALGQLMNIVLEAKEFKLEDTGQKETNFHLMTILRNQLPKISKDWSKWWLLYCEGDLIGATSPWTIVYTPADYRCPARIPWRDTQTGKFADPMHYYKMKEDGFIELALVHRWVSLVLDAHGWDMQPHLKEQTGFLRRELAHWKTDLDDYLQGFRGEQVLSDIRQLTIRKSDAIVVAAPHRNFLAPLEVREIRMPGGLWLATNPDKRQAIVLSQADDLSGRRVLGPVFADEIDFDSLTEASGSEFVTRTGVRINEHYLVPERHLLPRRLLQLESSGSAFGVNRKYSLPLTCSIFDYYTYDEVKELDIRVQEVGEDVVLATLRLPLRVGGSIDVKRKYERGKELLGVETVPALAIWPDFEDPDWEEYRLFLNNVGSASVAARAVVQDSKKGYQTLECSPAREEGLFTWITPDTPLGFELLAKDQGDSSMIEAGLILRDSIKHPKMTEAGRNLTIGVDFGTSNTAVMARDESLRVVDVELGGRTLMLTKTAQLLARELTWFFPMERVRPPFATLAGRTRARLVGADHRGSEDVGAVLHGAETYIVSQKPGGIITKIKWGTGGQSYSDKELRGYLESLRLQILAEAKYMGVATLKIRWSYPLSLSVQARQSMKDFWEATRKRLPKGMEVGEVVGVSESAALARCLGIEYSNILPVTARALSIAIDIGGGSADFGFWTEGRLLGGSSMKLAGNDILGPMIKSKPSFSEKLLEIVVPRTPIPALVDAFRSREKSLTLCNLLLTSRMRSRQRGEDVRLRDMNLVGAEVTGGGQCKAEDPWKTARSLIYLYGMGLAFYTGLHARKYIKENDLKETHVYFGGLGSLLFNWLGNPELVQEILSHALRKGIAVSDEVRGDVLLKLYGPGCGKEHGLGPKMEVATGLLARELQGEPNSWKLTEGCDALEIRAILCEVGWVDGHGEVIQWDREITPAELLEYQIPQNLESCYIAGFMSLATEFIDQLGLDERLHELLGSSLSTAEIEHTIRVKTRASVVEAMAPRTIEHMKTQPVFGYELGFLLKEYEDRFMKG